MVELVGRKPLLDRIRAADLKRGVDKTAGSNRRVLLAHRDDLEAALAHGYSLRRLHTQLREEGVLATDYSSFLRAARTAGLSGKKAALPSPALPSPALPVATTPVGKLEWKFERPDNEPREFVHNPRPKREPWG